MAGARECMVAAKHVATAVMKPCTLLGAKAI